MTHRVCLSLGLVLAWSVGLAQAENWPQWRGPSQNGISTAKDLPTKWSPTENVLWKVPMPGPAGSTPVIWGDNIFLSSVIGDDLYLLCYSTDGKQRWKQKVDTGNKNARINEGNSAAPSPCTDGEHVWIMMGTGTLACFDNDGKEEWKVDLQKRYGKFRIQFGMTSTPVLDNDKLYLQLIHTGGAWVICLDKSTGKEVWKVPRKSDAIAECEHSYASPVVYRDKDREFLLTHGADYAIAYSLKDGTEIFRCGELNPKGEDYNRTLRLVASPAINEGLVVIPSAKNGPVMGIPVDAKGDVTHKPKQQTWKREKNTPDVPSPLIKDGLVYLCRETGILLCLDAKTGEEIYMESVHRQRHRGSPVYADGKIYLSARDGVISVIKAGRKYELLAKNEMKETLAASPAIADGKIYLRTYDNLYCIGKK